MLIENFSEQVICCTDSFEGAPKDDAMILQPGQKLYIESVLPDLHIAFVTTPGGLRVSVRAEEPHLWTPRNGHAR